MNGKMRFGQLAVSMGLVSSAQVEECLLIQKKLPQSNHQPLGQIMIKQGYISSDAVSGVLQRQTPQNFNDLDDEISSDMEIEEIEELEDLEDSSAEMLAEDISQEMVVEDDDEQVEDGIPLDLGYSDSMKSEMDDQASQDFDINSAQEIFVDDESGAQDAVSLSTSSPSDFTEQNENSFSSNSEFDTEQPIAGSDASFDIGSSGPFDTGGSSPFDPTSESDSGFDVGQSSPFDTAGSSPFDTGGSSPFDPTSESDSGFGVGGQSDPFDTDGSSPFDPTSESDSGFGVGGQSDPFDTDGSSPFDPTSKSDSGFDVGQSNPFDTGGSSPFDPTSESDSGFDAGGQSDPFDTGSTSPFDPISGSDSGFDTGSSPFDPAPVNDSGFDVGGQSDPFDTGNSPFDSPANDVAQSSPFDTEGNSPFDPVSGSSDPFDTGGNSPFDPSTNNAEQPSPFDTGASSPFEPANNAPNPFDTSGNSPFDPVPGNDPAFDVGQPNPFNTGNELGNNIGQTDPFDTGGSSPFDPVPGNELGNNIGQTDPFDTGGNSPFDPVPGNELGNNIGQTDPFDTGGNSPFDPASANGSGFDLGQPNAPFDTGSPFVSEQSNDLFAQPNNNPFEDNKQSSDPFSGANSPFESGPPQDSFPNDPNSPFNTGTNPNDIFSSQPAPAPTPDSFFNQFPDTGNNSGFDIFGQPNQPNQVSPEDDATISEEGEGAIDLFSQSSIDKIATGEEITLSDGVNQPNESGSFFNNAGNQNLDSFFTGQGDPFNPNSDPTIDLSGGSNLPMDNVIDLENSHGMPSETFGMQPIADPINLENSMNAAGGFDPSNASDATISYENNNNLLTGEPNAQTQEWDWESINNQNQQLPPDSDIESDFFNPPDLRSDIKAPQPQAGPFDLPDVVNTGDVTIAAAANPNMPNAFPQNIGTFPPTDSPFPGNPAPNNNFAAPSTPKAPAPRRNSSRRPASKKINIPRQRSSRISRRVSGASDRSNSLSSKEFKYLIAVLVFCFAILIAVAVVVVMQSNGGERRAEGENGEETEYAAAIGGENPLENDPENGIDNNINSNDISEEQLASYYEKAKESMKIDSPPQTNEAIKTLGFIISKNPNYKDAYLLRAQCYFRSNRYREARLDAEKAIENSSDETQCYYILAACAQKNENYDRCIEFCNKVLETNPSFLKAKSIKMKVLKAKGLLIEALKLAKELERDKYEYAKGDIQNARVAILGKALQGQKELLYQAIELDEDYAPFYYELAMLSYRIEETNTEALKQAKSYIGKYLELSKSSNDTPDMRYLVMKELHTFAEYQTGSINTKKKIHANIVKKLRGKKVNFLPCLSLIILTDVQQKILKSALKKNASKSEIKKKEKTLFYYMILAIKARVYVKKPSFQQNHPRESQLVEVSFNSIAASLQEYQKKIDTYMKDKRFMKYFSNYISLVVKDVPKNHALKVNDVILRFDDVYMYTSYEFSSALSRQNSQYQSVYVRRSNKIIQLSLRDIVPGALFTHNLLTRR
ncbi:CDC27 family protein [Candidatus Uabimicrobium sp. HlEnr_7]|uniref:CDC27 family protein n=1 Tax=Candidatus Uabimicrobium helgolandensis TaxID=3095367 RepID=UPI00355858B5